MSINLSKEKYDASHIQTEKMKEYDASHIQTEKMKECVPN